MLKKERTLFDTDEMLTSYSRCFFYSEKKKEQQQQHWLDQVKINSTITDVFLQIRWCALWRKWIWHYNLKW